MKTFLLKILHTLLGYERYLKLFSIFKIHTLALNRQKSDFRFFTGCLTEDAVVVVVGACTGITTVPLAKGHPNRTVIAYEPQSDNFRALNRVVRHFRLNNVRTFRLGLGNRSETRQIVLPVFSGVKKQGIAHIVDPALTEHNDGLTEAVEMDSLDNREELQSLRISDIKIVAENFEYAIIEGAKNLLEKNRPLIYCELWDNEKRQPVLDLIRSYGYTVCNREKDEVVPYDPAVYPGKRFFFLPVR